MRKARKCESGFFFIHFSFCQEGEDDLRELVHHGDHSLPVAESFTSLPVIISTEEGGIDDCSLSHYIGVFPEAPVAVFGNMASTMAFSGLVVIWPVLWLSPDWYMEGSVPMYAMSFW